MNKQTIFSVLKSIILILIVLGVAFFLRTQSANLAAVSDEYIDYFQDPDGLPYFTEMDSYYNLRLTENFINTGTLGDSVVNGSQWDSLSYAPPGRAVDYTPLIVYVTTFLYYLANIFTEMSLTEVAFWACTIIAPLSAIPAFIIVRRMTNGYGGVTAALLISLSPNFFTHTYAGFFDTDMFTVLIPLFVILFFIESVRASKFIYRLISAILTVLSLILFSFAWTGYIFYAGIIVGVIIVYLIAGWALKIDIIKPRKNYSNILSWFVDQKAVFSIVFIAILGFIGLGVFNGFGSIFESISGIFGATQLQALAQSTSYPNVYISVAELQVPNLLYGGLSGAFLANTGGIVNGIGGIVALFGALIILFVFAQRLWMLRSVKSVKKSKKPPKGQRQAAAKVQANKHKETIADSTLKNVESIDDVNEVKRETLFYFTLFAVWILGSAIAVTQGSRFIQVLMIPLSLCVGVFVGYAANYIKYKINSKNILMAIAAGGTFLIVFPIYSVIGSFENGIMYTLLIALILIVISALTIYGTGRKSQKSNKSQPYIKNFSEDDKSSRTPIKKLVVVVILTLALISPTVLYAYQASYASVPSTSDPMWDSMLWVKANTTKDTVVTSWWDFGYLFEIASERRTTFDGGSQNSPRAFWVGKAMTEDNPDLSAGIFEMLATSGDDAYYTLDNYTNDTGKSVEILEKTLIVSREEAKTIMTEEYNLSSSQSDNVLQYSHPTNATPVIFVASSDLLQKAGWWTYFGSWDFNKQESSGYQYMISDTPTDMKKVNSTTGQANITNLEENNILFQTVVTKNYETNNTTATVKTVFAENGSEVYDQNGTLFQPFSLYSRMIIDDGYLMVNETVNKSGNYSLLVIGNNNSYSSVLMSKELEYSLFTRLYLLGGYDQDRFELVSMESGVSLWQINPKSS